MNIPFSLSNVAGIAVAPINASATVKAGGAGGKSVFAGFVVGNKGKPFEVIKVTPDNWQEKLGTPLKPSAGKFSGSLRVMEDALKGGEGYVVRVVPNSARFVAMSLATAADQAAVNVTTITALGYGLPISLAESEIIKFYVNDGDIKARSLQLTQSEIELDQFTLTLFAKTEAGQEYVEKEWVVSIDPHAKNDTGDSLFITDVLTRASAVIQCLIADNVDNTMLKGFGKTALVGATSGEHDAIVIADWQKAAKVLKNSMVGYTAVVDLGIADPEVTSLLVTIADSRRIDCFADIKADNYAAACEAATASGFNNHRLCLYYFPYTAKDPHFGGQMYWGIAGLAFKAKAAGVMKVTGSVGGWHYSPAGMERGTIDRKSPMPFADLDEPDYEQLYKCRINKLGLTSSGMLMIDDAITTHQKEDYLRFQHVSSLMDAISREFYSLASQLQHEPDGLTYRGLNNGMSDICQSYVAASALVKPRNEDDGEQEFIINIKQVEIDYWQVQWFVCPTGVSRRIMGEPALMR